ncbi:MAG: fatty acid desaturase [Myxococcota bacterium]
MKERDAWKAHAGMIAWPTIALGAFVAVAHAALWWASTTRALPVIAIIPLATLVAYLAFTVLHEAAHGNIHGSTNALRPLSTTLGWLSGAILGAPYPAFRVLHLQHHSHTNHPEKDPDLWVAGRGITVVLRCFTIVPHYYATFLVGESSRSKAGREKRTQVIAATLLLIGIAFLLAFVGFGREVLFVWLLPAFLASGVLAFLFDWLPHHPHNVQGRYRDTRAIPIPGLGVPTLGQNLHLIHHLFPRVPFYRYHRVFALLRPRLEEKKAPIGAKPMVLRER